MEQKNNKENVLFSRKNPNENSEDVWDDRALIRAYEKSIRKIKQEISKKTVDNQEEKIPNDLDLDEEDDDEEEYEEENEFEEENEGYYDEDEEEEQGSINAEVNDLKKRDPNDWKLEDLCMAIYSKDGLLYPANIIRIFQDENNRKKCIVKYLYYMNEEEKFIDEIYEFIPKKYKNLESNKIQLSEEKSKISEKMKPVIQDTVSIQMPPPPMPFDILKQTKGNVDENDALHSMLLSWYMNGYHTGYYLGLKQAKEKSN
ncbi:unnamed protein product [Brachionus calyciflorus]|uniref:Tudor domain-containing protein n=1 Tax=Brachionus calyciflorus TaxID=104777 RepID=A0A813XQR1_9BILA|nr:unnamed protein product [Brachionus calyciflorus]